MRNSKQNTDNYRITIRPLSKEEGGGYLVEYPEIPGCMSDGETIEEAVANGREALRDCLDVFRESGRKVLKPGVDQQSKTVIEASLFFMLKNDTQQGPPDVCGMVRSPVIPKREIPFSGGIFMASGVQIGNPGGRVSGRNAVPDHDTIALEGGRLRRIFGGVSAGSSCHVEIEDHSGSRSRSPQLGSERLPRISLSTDFR